MELLEKRKQEERDFHDKLRAVENDPHVADTRWSPALEATIKNNPLWVNTKYYSVERSSRAMVLDWFRRNCRDKVVLDYCCGNGEDSIQVARAGAKSVIGIDISDISIANCTKLAEANGVSHVATFRTADAERTGFADNSFDIITEYGSLHHLDLERSMAELARLIRSDGKIICNETLGHNPIIHLYRKLTPHLRTAWEVEHIIRSKHFRVMEKYFGKVELHFFHLFTLLGVPFRNTPVFGRLLSLLEGIDRFVLKLPFLRWQAWQVVFILSEPKKAS